MGIACGLLQQNTANTGWIQTWPHGIRFLAQRREKTNLLIANKGRNAAARKVTKQCSYEIFSRMNKQRYWLRP